VEEAALHVCGRIFYFFMQREGMIMHPHANCGRAWQRRRRRPSRLAGAKGSVAWAQARHGGGGPMADVHGGDNGASMRPSAATTEEEAA
jgi:hypothetical protein